MARLETIQQLLEAFDEDSLADFARPYGKRMQRIGKGAGAILRSAQSMESGKEIPIQAPENPEHSSYVMFDLEGLPPHLDELEKIYLWGMQVFGEKPSDYMAALAGFGDDGDRQGWDDFLDKAAWVFEHYGDIPFVHWAVYERVKIDLYIERFGDRDGIAGRVRKNLLDLLPIAKESIALPLPSYSLKVIEGYVGFKRTQEEYGGDWAMAAYIEATETEDEEQRSKVMAEILKYNQEDLEATWAVLKWLRSFTSTGRS